MIDVFANLLIWSPLFSGKIDFLMKLKSNVVASCQMTPYAFTPSKKSAFTPNWSPFIISSESLNPSILMERKLASFAEWAWLDHFTISIGIVKRDKEKRRKGEKGEASCVWRNDATRAEHRENDQASGFRSIYYFIFQRFLFYYLYLSFAPYHILF